MFLFLTPYAVFDSFVVVGCKALVNKWNHLANWSRLGWNYFSHAVIEEKS